LIESFRHAKFQGGNDYWTLVQAPYALFMCLMSLDQRDQALEVLADAERQASQSDSQAVRSAIAVIRMEHHIAASPLADAKAFWDANAAAMHEACNATTFDPMGELARRIAAEESPDVALAFVRKQPVRWLQRSLTDYYEQQSRLASRTDLDKTLHWVQIDSIALRKREASTNHYQLDYLQRCRPPMRVEMTLQTTHVFEPGDYANYFTIRLISDNVRTIEALGYTGWGGFRVFPGFRNLDPLFIPTHRARTASHRVVMEFREGGLLVELDGVPLQRTCTSLPDEFTLMTHTCGLATEVRDVRVFVPTNKPLTAKQTREVADARTAFAEAFASGDATKAKTAADTLKQRLAGAPLNARALLNARLGWFQDVLTPQGASLLDKRMQLMTFGDKWAVRGQTLTLDRRANAERVWPVNMQNKELAGLIDTASDDEQFSIRLYVNDEDSLWFWPAKSSAGFNRNMFGIAQTQPSSFVLRIRDNQAVLFVNNGDKPAATVELTEPASDRLLLRARPHGENDRATFLQFHLRNLPDGIDLESPATMPTVKPTTAPAD
jgi:hypothetical protein